METLKITVELQVDAAAPSEKAQNFFAALAAFAKMGEERVAPTTRTAKTRKPTTDEKESTTDQGNRAAVADSRSAADGDPSDVNAAASAVDSGSEPAQGAPAAASSKKAVTLDDVRAAALAAKSAGHRDKIKAKLEEFGMSSITTLDPSKYEEMYNYLKGLN